MIAMIRKKDDAKQPLEED